ncbi:hypothetical protein ACHAXR_009190 [Thalassiosira sp. AJA248-18]
MRVFIGGLGYCGSRIAAAIHSSYPNCIISGTVRSAERRDGMLSSPPNWLTGVYGDHDGEWVNEESELRCVDVKSMARVRAEREWMQLEKGDGGDTLGDDGVRVDCFRCGGIYGPGRGLLFSSMESLNQALADDEGAAEDAGDNKNDETQQQQQRTIPKYVNRILVDDICSAILASISGERSRCGGRAYNLVDDDPVPRREVVAEARRLLLSKDSREKPQQDRGTETTPATKNTRRRISRAAGNKRCDNKRLKEEYGWELTAPTYREGLALLLENYVLFQ